MVTVQRAVASVRARLNRMLDRLEDPEETLAYALMRQMKLLGDVQARMERAASAREQAEADERRALSAADRLEEEARTELAYGGEALAREALIRRAGALARVEELAQDRRALIEQERRLAEMAERLQERIEEFHALAETVKTSRAGDRARASVEQAVTAVGADAEQIEEAIRRAAMRIAVLQERARALQEAAACPPDDNTRATASQVTADVDAQLSRLKSELRGRRRQ